MIGDAAAEVGPALFFSLLIITLSFVPVFTLEAQEGRLFAPLAFTKTYAMAAAAGLSVTLIPVLMGYWIRGRIPDEQRNPLNRCADRALPAAAGCACCACPRRRLLVAVLVLLATAVADLRSLGGEFLPPLDEGDLLYMPSALPGLSAGKAAELLQQTDKMIRDRAGSRDACSARRAAPKPRPIRRRWRCSKRPSSFKPREQWRPGMTPEKLIEELDRSVRMPGLTNLWVPPIRNRHRHARDRHQESDRHQGLRQRSRATSTASPREIERAVKDVPGCHLGAGRAPDRRALHRRRHRSRPPPRATA